MAAAHQAQAQQTPSPASNPVASAVLPDAPQSNALPSTQPSPTVPPQEQQAAPNGIIHGVVSDRNGAVYQGARVTLTLPAPATIPAKTVETDSDGHFRFDNVPPGPFQLTISAQGFATQSSSGVLQPSQSFESPAIVLPFATATTDVRVTASQQEIAQAQLKEEEQQRVFGVLPNFYVVYAPNAAPLSPRQKFHLALRSSVDPVTFLISGAFAGIEQATGEFSGYGQGAEGYAKRFGANFADNFIANMIGGAILPSALKQDPRYFYKGTGTKRSRVLYAIANSVMCKSDRGRWQVNYSGILGGMAAGGISNLYYPAANRNGISLTLENAAMGIAGSAVQNVFQEFIVRRLTPKVPKYAPSQP